MNRKNLLLIAAVTGYFIILLDLPLLLQRTTFYAFQTRDLYRASEILRGNWVFYGPEMTGGGNLPGPLYYLLLAPSLLFGGRWEHAWILMIILISCSAVFAWWYLRSIGFKTAALLACSLLGAAVVTQHFLTLFINPSYQFIFVVPALIFICRAFDPLLGPAVRGRSAVGAGVCIALGIQIHYSVAFLVPALLTLQAAAHRLQLPRLEWRYLAAAVTALPLISLPYVLWKLGGKEAGDVWGGVGNNADVILTLFHLLGALRKISGDDLLNGILMQILNHVPPALYLLAATLWWIPAEHSQSDSAARGAAIAKILAVCAGFGFIPFSYIFAVPIANRYGLTMFVALILLAAVLFERILASTNRLRVFNSLAATAVLALAGVVLTRPEVSAADAAHAGLLVAAGTAAALLLYFNSPALPAGRIAAFVLALALAVLHREYYRSGSNRGFPNVMVRYESWRAVWKNIYAETGWSVGQIKRRIYFVNTHIDGDPEPVLKSVIGEMGPVARRPDAPDGYFVVLNPPVSRAGLAEWLASQPVNQDIKNGLRAGAIRLGAMEWHGLWTVPYHVDRSANLPRSFHNWAMFYQPSEAAGVLAEGRPDTVSRLADGRFLFHWNECPDRAPYCDSGALVRLERVDGGRYDITVEVLGDSLSQNSPWIYPTWTQAWIKPYVEFDCGGTKQLIELAADIGYRRDYMLYQPVNHYFVANNSWLAPFERRFQVTCPAPLKALSVGRAGGSADRLRSIVELPPRRLTVTL